jgi:predicted GIY-YIG superfamily endonuclease
MAQTSATGQVKNGRVEKTYYVYIMSSQRRLLYIRISGHIERRVHQHKSHTFYLFDNRLDVFAYPWLFGLLVALWTALW